MASLINENERKKQLEKARSLASVERRYKDAYEIIEKLLNQNGNDIDALLLKGNILDLEALSSAESDTFNLVDIDNHEIAKTCYEKILSIDSTNVPAIIDIADYWERKGELERALYFYNKAIELLKKKKSYYSYEDEVEEAYWGKIEVLKEMNRADEISQCVRLKL